MPWFKRIGWFHVPVSAPGFVLTVLAVLFCAHIFLFVDSRSNSVTDTLYGIFPFVVPTFLVLDWIARRTSPAAAASGD